MKRTLLILVLLIMSLGMIGYSELVKNTQPDTEPLITIMQDLMEDMNKINRGIWYEDYSRIDSAAHRIAYHPKAHKEQRLAIADTLGKQMGTFAKYDKVVHNHADSMSKAAKQKNMQAILRHYSIVQEGCMQCHAEFRDKLSNVLSK